MNARAENLFHDHVDAICRRTDRMFAVLMAIEYVGGIAAALLISPKTWSGSQSSIHVHVLAAVVLGALILSLPITLALVLPGRAVTRHVIAVAQMLDSALLIHLSGGRIETHFHIFGSLAFLAFYRDWRVLISASTVVALDHFLRGLYWPQSVYGVLSPSPFRWIEHTTWVVFEDIFIVLACRQSIHEMREIAVRRAFVEQVAQERAENISELQETRGQLNEALKAKTAFMSICGHELKTPLTSLSLQNQLAARAIRTGDTALLSRERISSMVNQTDSQIKRLLRLVDDMLDQSRIQMGKLKLEVEDVDLSELIEEVVGRYQQQAESAGSPIWLDNRQPLSGRWDRFRIEQVVTNLVSNAIKYGAGKPLEIGLSRRGNTAVIAVRDHGSGIAKEHHSKIFEQFERVSPSPHIAGLGLGLYITKNIVEQHGGTIRVESQPGQGSCFLVQLPLDAQAGQNAQTG
ncbi:MAG: HAMP domain-containing histidine kinase [Deltaproteobacteria bacterium]|nr:HAMP domain-containing histidine kinase [Deltaproteobacteria bacterium]